MHRQRFAVVAALLLAACASSGSNHNVGITVFETVTASPYGGLQAVTLLGSHLLRVQFENHSNQMIVVHSIQLDPADPDLFSDDPSQNIELTIGPGQQESVDMYMTVSTSSRTRSTTSQTLDSVRVDLACTGSETGDFIAGGTYSVLHAALGH
jgi:hypothetical protein